MTYEFAKAGRASILSSLILIGISTAGLIWAFWTTLAETAQSWSHDPQYSHGYLVPAFALLLLWLRRQYLTSEPPFPDWW